MTIVVVTGRGLPYSAWRRLASTGGRVRKADPVVVSARQIVRAVDTASRFVPCGTNCLVRALTTRMLMARYGLGSTLHLGVAKGSRGNLEGHAWLEHEGVVVVGERGRDEFLPMPHLDSRL
jgi:hypothetical protein